MPLVAAALLSCPALLPDSFSAPCPGRLKPLTVFPSRPALGCSWRAVPGLGSGRKAREGSCGGLTCLTLLQFSMSCFFGVLNVKWELFRTIACAAALTWMMLQWNGA